MEILGVKALHAMESYLSHCLERVQSRSGVMSKRIIALLTI
jgi:hypothetical protein